LDREKYSGVLSVFDYYGLIKPSAYFWILAIRPQIYEFLWNYRNGEESQDWLAERVGFEPTVEFPLHTLSKRAP
jgi:hypothetical protein